MNHHAERRLTRLETSQPAFLRQMRPIAERLAAEMGIDADEIMAEAKTELREMRRRGETMDDFLAAVAAERGVTVEALLAEAEAALATPEKAR